MAQAPSLWGNAIDGFTNALSNPLTLGGLSLLSGGDLNQGIAAGTQLQKQAQQQRQMQAFQQGIQGMPNLTDNDRSILSSSPDLATSVLGEIYKNRFDPNAALNTQYKQAQIKKLQAEAADAGSAYGKTGTVVQGSDGKYYSIQFGSRGQRQILPLELGGAPAAAGGTAAPPVSLAPQRGVEVVGDQIIDKATGAPVRNVAPNLQGGEFAKKSGALNAEGANNLPKIEATNAQAGISDNVVYDAIGQARTLAKKGWTTGFTGSLTSNIPGTPAHDLSATLDTIKSNLGFDKLQDMRNNSPTGGALGNVSDTEGRLLQSVFASLSQSQSQKQFLANLDRIEAIKKKYAVERQKAYLTDVARYGKANVADPVTGLKPGQQPKSSGAPQSRPRAVNPQTGQTVEFDGQNWVEVH